MPGGRLTHDDRRQIAAWLSAGLGYAEIARRLGRPTSTISREVARNSGPNGYLAERAQQAAGRRARRRRPRQSPAEEWPAASVRDFVENFAALLAATGLPRMPARVFVCLLTSESGSLAVAELVRRLQVSPASVSKAIGYLEAMELVGRRSDGGRRERYLIDDDVWIRAWRADTGAHARLAEAARHGVELFGPGTPAGTRLGQMGQFFAHVSQQMNGSALADSVVQDALTVVAALVHAARPLSADDLTNALDWPGERTAEALNAIDRYPAIADPLTLDHPETGTYALSPRPDRLSAAQRKAVEQNIPF